MNGADLRLFEPAERTVQPVTLFRILGRLSSRLFERLAQTKFQLTGRLFCERNSDDSGDLGTAGLDDAHDTPYQLRGFTGAGGGLDDQRLIERGGNLVAISAIRKCRLHGRPLN